MENIYYKLYQQKCSELEEMMFLYDMDIKSAKKLRGAIAVELLKQLIEEYFYNNSEPYKVSAVNSYMIGSKYEYDLIIIKQTAVAFMGIVYHPEDVIAIIECKVGGLYNVENDTDYIAKAVNCAIEINSNIMFGYITMSENVPVNDKKRDGSPTFRHWDKTIECLEQKISEDIVIYAVTLDKGKKLFDKGSDTEFYKFIRHLISKNISV